MRAHVPTDSSRLHANEHTLGFPASSPEPVEGQPGKRLRRVIDHSIEDLCHRDGHGEANQEARCHRAFNGHARRSLDVHEESNAASVHNQALGEKPA